MSALRLRSFRPLRLLFVSFVCFVVPLGLTAATEFVRVWPAWRDAASFERIAEYFGQPEPTGREAILRTQPAARDGYYFLVRVKNTDTPLPANTRFELHVIRPDHPEPKVFTFPAALRPKETIFHLGLTGADWPGGKETNPVAWKIALLSADNRVLAEHKSFLWEKPSK